MKPKALIAMSGGVDSSVAAALTMNAGYDCVGATMKLFCRDDACTPHGDICGSPDDIEDARRAAFSLGMPYEVFDFSPRFKEEVIERFVSAYERGATPNPCVDCNRFLKFGALFSRAEDLGCNHVVTGHYARIEFDEEAGRYLLKKAVDESKDQSYFLFFLSQEQLSRTLFPLGGMKKPQVRAVAQSLGLLNAAKRESQDICFVQNGRYADFIEQYTGRRCLEGHFVDRMGKVLGTHKGIIHYTVGQRRGLGLSLHRPYFVCAVDPVTHTVTLGDEDDLLSRSLVAKGINLIALDSIEAPMRLKAKVRYRQTEQWATVTQTDDDTLQVVFDEPLRAIARGQALVLYDGDTVVGGGTIQ